jgi:hypothetical protein
MPRTIRNESKQSYPHSNQLVASNHGVSGFKFTWTYSARANSTAQRTHGIKEDHQGESVMRVHTELLTREGTD